MGACFPKLLPADRVIGEKDGQLMYTCVTGGLILVRGNMQQNLPGGTLFITDRKVIHCTKFFGYHRIEFRLSKLKDLESTLTFGSNCQVTMPCCRGLPDSYLVFKSKFHQRLHSIGIKLKDSDEVLKRVEKLIKKYQQRLSVIEEEKEITKQKPCSSSSSPC